MYTEEQLEVHTKLSKVLEIFCASQGEIRPHFILTGPSGSGKSHMISLLAEEFKLGFLEINAAQLTKEGTSGNSLSKALAPLQNINSSMNVVFVDEFDKLFISGNGNEPAHETTSGVQNEFLKVLESDHTSVYGDYAKYVKVDVSNTLFVFAGAFNGIEDISLDTLREFGIKTEFLGRVGLVYNTTKPTLESLMKVLDTSSLLSEYLELFDGVVKQDVITSVRKHLEENYEHNTLGVRMLNNLVHSYFIEGGLDNKVIKKVTFSKKLKLKGRYEI